jgi:hypothetical protein
VNGQRRRLIFSSPSFGNSTSHRHFAAFNEHFASKEYLGDGAVVAGGLGGGVESLRGAGMTGSVVIGTLHVVVVARLRR